MPEFKKILCPVQFDPNSFRALRLAGEMSQRQSADLYVLHVVDVAIPPKAEVTVPFDKMEVAVTTRLERLARQKIDAKIRHEIQVESGDPALKVLGAAKRLHADLIVMATHGRKGLRRLVLGSVAERVVREAPCPVLTLTPTAGRVRKSRIRNRPKT